MVLCKQNPMWSHDFLLPGIPCPYCTNEPGNTSSKATPSMSMTTVTPSPISDPAITSTTSSTSVPAIPAASAAFIPTARQAVNTAQYSRSRAILQARTTPILARPPQNNVHLLIKVAHAVFEEGSAIPTFQRFAESWQCSIPYGQVFMNPRMLALFVLRDGRNVHLLH
jgi:hypothetical protein